MNHIERLIQQHCPNGVPFHPLGEVGKLIRGSGLQKKDFQESGVGCIHYGQIYTHYGTFADETISFVSPELAQKLKKASKGDIIISGVSENIEDICTPVAWLGDNDICVSGDTFVFKHQQNPKYIAYNLQTDRFQKFKEKYAIGAKVTRLQSGALAKYPIPIPPLAVQEAIVEVLDKFTELDRLLNAELVARQQQYEYYRNQLLTFDDKVPRIPLGEVCDTVAAPRKLGKQKILAIGNYPVIDQGQSFITGYTDDFDSLVEKGEYVIFGDHTREIKFVDFSFAQGADGLKILKSKSFIIPKFLYYSFTNLTIPNRGYNRHWSVVKEFPIPVPSVEEQERIVAVLDRFDALVNSLSVGLPAEIEARRQQYEYYRNQLLTFTPCN